jgi:hypothetical protein
MHYHVKLMKVTGVDPSGDVELPYDFLVTADSELDALAKAICAMRWKTGFFEEGLTTDKKYFCTDRHGCPHVLHEITPTTPAKFMAGFFIECTVGPDDRAKAIELCQEAAA